MITLHRLWVSIFALLFFVFSAAQLQAAKAPSFTWANKLWGGDDDGGFGFAVDSEGNSYIATAFFGTDTLSGITMTNAGLYIAKNSPAGNLLWARQIAQSKVYCNSLALDAAGNIFLVGGFFQTVTFGTTNLNNPSSFSSDAFVAKFSSTGDLRWVRQVSGSFYDQANGVAVDTNGNVFVTGLFSQTAFFGSTNLSSRGEDDIFVAKYGTDGNLIWVRQAGGTSDDFGFSVAVSPAGEVWVGGIFGGTAHFDGFTLTSVGQSSGFLAQYDVDGHVAWVHPVGGSGFWNSLLSVAVDQSGNGVACGYYSGSNALNGAVSPGGFQDAIVVRYDRFGQLLWARTGGGPLSDFAENVALDRAGNVYLTGSFHESFTLGEVCINTTNELEQVFVAKLDRAGNVVFLKNAAGTKDDYGYGIGVDAHAHCYVAGFFGEEIIFDDMQLSSTQPGPTHTFVARVEAPQPALTVELVAGQLRLSWPLWAADFDVEWTPTLEASSSWMPVAALPASNDERWMVRLSMDSGKSFFRLRQQ